MVNKPLDLTKPVRTRGGRSARIVCSDFRHNQIGGMQFPIIALVDIGNGREALYTYTAQGRMSPAYEGLSNSDLVNVPEKVTVCIYKMSNGKGYWIYPQLIPKYAEDLVKQVEIEV